MRVVIRIRIARLVEWLRLTFTLAPNCGACGAPCMRVGSVWVCEPCLVRLPSTPAQVFDLAEERERRRLGGLATLPPFVRGVR